MLTYDWTKNGGQVTSFEPPPLKRKGVSESRLGRSELRVHRVHVSECCPIGKALKPVSSIIKL